MFRRAVVFAVRQTQISSKQLKQIPKTIVGAYNVTQVAEKLNIDKRYAQGLLLEEDRMTFKGRGRAWPATLGRSSRPGSKACTHQAMFPLYHTSPELRYKLDKSFRKLSNQ